MEVHIDPVSDEAIIVEPDPTAINIEPFQETFEP
jgi:hypothetical protein